MIHDIFESTKRCRRRSNVSGGVGFGLVIILLFLFRPAFALSLILHREVTRKAFSSVCASLLK